MEYLKDVNLLGGDRAMTKKDKKSFNFDMDLGHPFSHWSNHMSYIGQIEPQDIINQSLFHNHHLKEWLFGNLPCFHKSSKHWNAGDVKKFYLTTLQTSMSSGLSTLSSYSSMSY